MHVPVFISRRKTPRASTPEGVWVYWRYAGRDDTSRVKNLSVGGLFIETKRRAVLGANAKIEFLIREGQIRAEAIVKHGKLYKQKKQIPATAGKPRACTPSGDNSALGMTGPGGRLVSC